MKTTLVRTTPAGSGRASFTAGDYSIRERAAALAVLLMRGEFRANVARAHAAHEIDIDLHG